MSGLENAPVYTDAKIALLRRAIERAPNSAGHMFDLADLLAERGEFDEYARIFQSAYKLDPRAQRLLEIDGHEARALRNKAQALVGRGVNYSAVLAALAISSARLGERATVERLIDYGSVIQACFARCGRDTFPTAIFLRRSPPRSKAGFDFIRRQMWPSAKLGVITIS